MLCRVSDLKDRQRVYGKHTGKWTRDQKKKSPERLKKNIGWLVV